MKVCGLRMWQYGMSLIFVLCVFVEKLFSGNGCCSQYFVKKKKKVQKPISLSELLTVMLGSWSTGPAAHERMKLLTKWLS